jgi:hypothetical protein
MIGPTLATVVFAVLIVALLWAFIRKPPPPAREGQRDVDPYALSGAGESGHSDHTTDGHS